MAAQLKSSIESHFESYSVWRETLRERVVDFKGWVNAQKLGDASIDQSLDQILTTLRDDKLYIAFVAEFSRGKSELINAIFFGGLGQRILPSAAGRTTMCPTELLYNRGSPPELKLLPIDTRKSGTTIAEYKSVHDEWVKIPLDPKSADRMAEALKHIAETTEVSREEATALGFHIAEDDNQTGMPATDNGMVQVPRWRHAIINHPHPLLDKGLVILDTPGLNALGAEPELTLSMLPQAHAILFILAADAGVTKSDIEVWHEHIASERASTKKGRIVVLNKIDGLWDDMREEADVNKEITAQLLDTARHLKVPESNIYPVSAQKGLLGKIKGDKKILERSRIMTLENALGSELVPAKQDIVRDNIHAEMDEVIKSTRAVIIQRLRGIYEHMHELIGLTGKNRDVVEHMMKKMRTDKEVFEKALQRFQATRSVFSQQTNVLYSHLTMKQLDAFIAETKRDMEVSMTTAGLKSSMKDFFSHSRDTMEAVSAQTNEIKEMMAGVYAKFQEEHGLSNIKPSSFSVMRYIREIKRLEKKHDQYTKGMSILFTGEKVVTKKFFESAVAKVRAIFKMANRDADAWLKNIMSPMEAQVREHQIQLRRRLESIKSIHQTSDTLQDRIEELETARQKVRAQEKALNDRVDKLLALLDPKGTEHIGEVPNTPKAKAS